MSFLHNLGKKYKTDKHDKEHTFKGVSYCDIYDKYFNNIEISGNRLLGLLDNLLDLAKLESGMMELDFTVINAE